MWARQARVSRVCDPSLMPKRDRTLVGTLPDSRAGVRQCATNPRSLGRWTHERGPLTGFGVSPPAPHHRLVLAR